MPNNRLRFISLSDNLLSGPLDNRYIVRSVIRLSRIVDRSRQTSIIHTQQSAVQYSVGPMLYFVQFWQTRTNPTLAYSPRDKCCIAGCYACCIMLGSVVWLRQQLAAAAAAAAAALTVLWSRAVALRPDSPCGASFFHSINSARLRPGSWFICLISRLGESHTLCMPCNKYRCTMDPEGDVRNSCKSQFSNNLPNS